MPEVSRASASSPSIFSLAWLNSSRFLIGPLMSCCAPGRSITCPPTTSVEDSLKWPVCLNQGDACCWSIPTWTISLCHKEHSPLWKRGTSRSAKTSVLHWRERIGPAWLQRSNIKVPNSHEHPVTMAQEPHQHAHDDGNHHEHDHEHGHAHGRMGRLLAAIPFLHGHRHGEAPVDRAMETNARGVWALKVSLMGLGATALFQLVIVLVSGSTGLLADSIHNVADALTAVPLWIAFALARRPTTRRYTYGYGRAEDIAGTIIVLVI